MSGIKEYEEQRLILQEKLDQGKNQAQRNKLGQFATPPKLAKEMLEYGTRLLPADEPVRFLDPAIGTGSFYSALCGTLPRKRIEVATGFEIDPYYGQPAASLWNDTRLKINLQDFTSATLPEKEKEKYNLLICNPPYVRHHHLTSSQKQQLQSLTKQSCDIRFNGLSGLYCYFIAISHAWMKEDGIAGWLIPSEFMDVNYGRVLKYYLLNRVTLLRIHRFDPNNSQFPDALVSSAIVWFKKKSPSSAHQVELTFGGTLMKPKMSSSVSTSTLNHDEKWNRFPGKIVRYPKTGEFPGEGLTLSSLFSIKRGLATGDNKFFILSEEQIKANDLPKKFFKPILPSPRYLEENEIAADSYGYPEIKKPLFLLDCPLSEKEIETGYPTLWKYLQDGKPRVASRYLCKNRDPWYSQEKRPPSPFVCTYMGRSSIKREKPFRFILNHSKATVANVYLLLYPRHFLQNALLGDQELIRKIWEMLNRISVEILLREGRVYGGGLYKLEPRELGNAPAGELSYLVPGSYRLMPNKGSGELFSPPARGRGGL